MEGDALCKECSDQYGTRLRSASGKTRQVSSRLVDFLDQTRGGPNSRGDKPDQLLALPISPYELQDARQVMRRRTDNRQLLGYFLLGIGLLALLASVLLASTILTFIGLGLVFWGMLMFFVQTHNYVRSDLLSATALSALKTINKMIAGLNYQARSVYIPTDGSDKALAFIPSPKITVGDAKTIKIPQGTFDQKTFLSDPEGLLVTPPGLALSNLVESKLGFNLKDCGVETLIRTLPKVLVEDLEVVRDVEIELTGDDVTFRLVDSVYANLCQEARDNSGGFAGLGCPMCSALACILTIATSKAVLLEEGRSIGDKKTIESSYQILSEQDLSTWTFAHA
jgi:hypothetical protein